MRLLSAVDVGTASARAGLFDATGRLLGRGEAPLETRTPAPLQAEQSSAQIWSAAGLALRGALAAAGVTPAAVAGLAFDATSSLVLRDAAGGPVGVGLDGADRWDTLLWLDHRAVAEAEAASAMEDRAVAQAGGALSPEMQLPKLMWLKRHLPGSWARVAEASDLADHLSWRATGNPARSTCTLASKWAWQPDGWPLSFLAAVGLADLPARAGRPVPVGAPLGPLTPAAARDLGLAAGTTVAAGLVDAHAGTLGVLGHLAGTPEIERHLALIGGTSACVMRLGATPRLVRGIWGPYLGAVLPGLWMSEGGQSASGALLDHVLRLHGHAPTADAHAGVVARVAALRAGEPDLAPRLHVLPDFHGSRSPEPDARALGAISGLALDASPDALAALYWRTCVAIALGLRAVVERLDVADVAALHLAGGHRQNPLLVEAYADAIGVPLVEPAAPEPVLLGTAMAAAAGAGVHPTLAAAGTAMHQGGRLRRPDPAAAARVGRDWRAFQAMRRHRAELERITKESP